MDEKKIGWRKNSATDVGAAKLPSLLSVGVYKNVISDIQQCNQQFCCIDRADYFASTDDMLRFIEHQVLRTCEEFSAKYFDEQKNSATQ